MPAREGYSEEFLLEELRKAAAELGHEPTQKEMNDRPGPSATIYGYYFGSWASAKMIAGVTSRTSDNPSRSEAIADIQRVGEEIGEPPRQKEYREAGAFSERKVSKVFGGWGEALQAAGFSPYVTFNGGEPEIRMLVSGRGWEVIRYLNPPEVELNDGVEVRHHRLLAVAWFGIDEVEDKVVHHVNGIPWDNREGNLQLLTSEEHGTLEAERQSR